MKNDNISKKLVGLVVVELIFLLGIVGYMANGKSPLGAGAGYYVSAKTDAPKTAEPRRARMLRLREQTGTAMRIAHAEMEPMVGLVEALEARGATVEMSETSGSEASLLRLKVDGVELSPMMISCLACEVIVFEY